MVSYLSFKKSGLLNHERLCAGDARCRRTEGPRHAGGAVLYVSDPGELSAECSCMSDSS